MTRSRRSEQREALRADVIDVARRQLEEGGPTAVSWRAIAREVGVSPSTLYTYFASLDELYTAMIVDAYHSLADAVATAVAAAGPDPTARVRAGVGGYRDWALAHRSRFNLVFTDMIPGYAAPAGGPTVAAQTAVLAPLGAAFAELRGHPDGDIRTWPDPDRHAALALWGQLHGLVSLEVNHHLDWTGEADQLFRAAMADAVDRMVAPG
ncbi:MAG TPA: TetR/AcrR family transcriptional regulator [Acidimicrobiales bacterium]|nr:TetR/AcrR family transcriptional regulator [Acidimicrobiales bacterium]